MRKVRFNSFFNSLTFKIVYYYHVTYKFQSESTLKVCLNVKELLAPSRTASEFESNEIRAHNRTVHKWTLNHLAKLANIEQFNWINESLLFQNRFLNVTYSI